MGGVDEKKEDKEGVGREWKTIISNIFFLAKEVPWHFCLECIFRVCYRAMKKQRLSCLQWTITDMFLDATIRLVLLLISFCFLTPTTPCASLIQGTWLTRPDPWPQVESTLHWVPVSKQLYVFEPSSIARECKSSLRIAALLDVHLLVLLVVRYYR